MVAEVVRLPGVSPGRWSLISIGIQVRKGAAGEATPVLDAMIPLSPGLCAVTTPTESTVATGVFALDQIQGPNAAVMSLSFGAHAPILSFGGTRDEQAWAGNGFDCIVV